MSNEGSEASRSGRTTRFIVCRVRPMSAPNRSKSAQDPFRTWPRLVNLGQALARPVPKRGRFRDKVGKHWLEANPPNGSKSAQTSPLNVSKRAEPHQSWPKEAQAWRSLPKCWPMPHHFRPKMAQARSSMSAELGSRLVEYEVHSGPKLAKLGRVWPRLSCRPLLGNAGANRVVGRTRDLKFARPSDVLVISRAGPEVHEVWNFWSKEAREHVANSVPARQVESTIFRPDRCKETPFRHDLGRDRPVSSVAPRRPMLQSLGYTRRADARCVD